MADVFISHSSKDKEIAELICNTLEANGIKCWIAPRDIRGGDDWSAAITDAISESKVFIIVYSKNSAQSTQVPREIALADSAHSHIIPYKIDDTELSSSFKYYLTSNHWVNAQSSAGSYNIDELVSAVSGALSMDNSPKVTVNNVVINMASINQNFHAAPPPEPVHQPEPDPVPVRQYEQDRQPEPDRQPAPANNSAAAAKKPISKKTVAIICIAAAALAVLIAAVIILSSVIPKNSNESLPDVSDGQYIPVNAAADENSGNDVIYSPADFEPYENYKAQIYSDDQNNSFTVLGEQYNTGIVLNAYDGSYIIYSNPDNYNKLRFTLARLDNTAIGDNTIRVYLDGVEQKLIQGNASFMPEELEYDITGISQIKIAMDNNFSVRAEYALMDISFSKSGAAVQEKATETASGDIANVPADKEPYENYKASIFTDDPNNTYTVLGKNSNTGILINAYDGSYVIFDNSEGYEKLSFTLARIDNTARGDNTIRVYLDGVEQKLIDGTSSFMPQEFEYDISGVKQIKISIDSNFSVRAYYALMDMAFSKNGAVRAETVSAVSSADIAYVPADKQPYENYCANIFADDPNNTYTVLRKNYNTGITLNAYDGSYVIFDNSEGYEKLSFTLARIDNTARGDNTIRVYLDGVEQKLIQGTSSFMPQEFEYNISGVQQIKIAMDNNFSVRAYYALMDIAFTKNGAEKPQKTAADPYADIAYSPVDKPPYENYEADIFADDFNSTYTVLGENYNTGIILNAYDGSYIIFDNNESYEKLDFTLARIDNTARGDNTIRVYLDGVEQKTIEANCNYMPQKFEYDLDGVKQIKIAMDNNFSVRAQYALMDIVFTKNGAEPVYETEEISAPDTANVPADKLPYETENVQIYNNDANNSFTVLGQSYNTGITFNAYDGSKINFHNKEGYSKFSFKLSKVDDTATGENTVTVYIDNVAQQPITLSGGAAVSSYEYDISGSSQVIVCLSNNFSSRATVALFDIQFSK